MKTSQAILILLFSFKASALPQSGHYQSLTEKVFTYCHTPDDPSIPCDETNPDGTFIDGGRPNPNETCSIIYFLCTNGTSKCFACPIIDEIYLYYDHPQLQCDYRENVAGCIGVPESTAISLTTVPTLPPRYVCPDADGFFPIDPNQCLPDYYICINGASIIETCPSGFLFYPATLYCVPEDQATCYFQCPVANGFLPVFGHETDQCFVGYIVCVSFVAYPQRCPPKSVFDPEDGFCVPASNNGCTGSLVH